MDIDSPIQGRRTTDRIGEVFLSYCEGGPVGGPLQIRNSTKDGAGILVDQRHDFHEAQHKHHANGDDHGVGPVAPRGEWWLERLPNSRREHKNSHDNCFTRMYFSALSTSSSALRTNIDSSAFIIYFSLDTCG